MRRLWAVSLVFCVLILFNNNAMAKGSYVGTWEGIYPDSSSSVSDCMLCHGESTSQFNEYGLDILNERNSGKDITAAIQNVEQIDSDNDPAGLSNIQEIIAHAQPGWTDGPNNTVYNVDGSTYLSGQDAPIQVVLDPITANNDPVAEANGPYSADIGTPVSFSSSGSSDSDGIIQTYLWSFGDGGTSTQANPIHTYADAGSYTVSLTVTDDLGATGSDTSTAVITVSPLNEPDIDMSPKDINFNQIEVGQTQTSSAEVRNIGTQTLNVSSIALCDGTSNEYNWSPAEMTIPPGGSLTLTVFYNPVDENVDDGCLEIISNDPDESSAFLNLTGSGFIPKPVMLDIDIKRFQVSKRISLKRIKPIELKLVASNMSVSDGSASSTAAKSVNVNVTGILGGSQVYNQTITVDIESDRLNILLPEYLPPTNSDIGDIEWTVEIIDEDPDADIATAKTKVVP